VVQASLLALVILVAVGSLWLREASLLALAPAVVASLVISGALIWGRDGAPDRRQRAWEIQAVGLALLAAAWLAGLGDH
jgi:hypothetical protein